MGNKAGKIAVGIIRIPTNQRGRSMHPFAAAAPAAAALVASAGAPAQQAAVPLGIEMFVVVVSSASGVLSARQHKLDYIGALWLALLVGLGGGLLRDIILQVGDVYILKQPLALPISLISATFAFVFPVIIEKQDRLLNVLDIFAVGLYAVVGADKAMVYGFAPTVCVMMGFFTAVGGGMLRDICLAKTPTIFKRGNFYAIAAIAGAGAYILLVQELGINNMVALVASTAITMFVRWISLHYNIQSPTEVDLTRVVPHRKRPAEGIAAARREGVPRSPDALADRRERTLADIERRREKERRKEALGRLRHMRRKRKQRKLDV